MALKLDPGGMEREVRAKCVKSLTELIILTALKDARMCGYDFITFVYDRFRVLLSPGTVYPVLQSLHSRGLVTEEQTERKRVYSLTPKGEIMGGYLSSEYVRVGGELQCSWNLTGVNETPDSRAWQTIPIGRTIEERKERTVTPF